MLKAAVAYFGVVFGIGFILGIIRTSLVVPRVGVRMAELCEIPFMLVAAGLAARWAVNRWAPRGGARWGMKVGGLALAFLVTAESWLGAVLQGVSPLDALRDRDPISGTAYYVALLVFAVLPWGLAGAHTAFRSES
jgi:hypothetical protein